MEYWIIYTLNEMLFGLQSVRRLEPFARVILLEFENHSGLSIKSKISTLRLKNTKHLKSKIKSGG